MLVRRVVRGVLVVGKMAMILSVTCAGVALALKMAAPSERSVSCWSCVVIPGPGFPFSRSLEIRFLSELISGGAVLGVRGRSFGVVRALSRRIEAWSSQTELVSAFSWVHFC